MCASKISYLRSQNWKSGHYKLARIDECSKEMWKEGVFCLQYDSKKIVGGCRDSTVKVFLTCMIKLSLFLSASHDIKIWDRETSKCKLILSSHTALVSCLQFDERVIITGSMDHTIRCSVT